MFDSLQQRLTSTFDRLRGRGALTEADVDEALARSPHRADRSRRGAAGRQGLHRQGAPARHRREVIRSVTPGQQVVKIVHDVLVETLGAENAALDLGSPPAPILMVGLQGSGKTTTSAKLGLLLQSKEKKRVLMASLDVRRPAAMEQLKILGEQAGVATLADRRQPGARRYRRRAMAAAKVGGYDVLILDTAGRQHIDEQLMAEVAAVREAR